MRVLIVDDQPIVRSMLRAVLEGEADLAVVGEAASAEEAVARVKALTPDVVVFIDLVRPSLPAMDALRRLQAATPSARIVVLTTLLAEAQMRTAGRFR